MLCPSSLQADHPMDTADWLKAIVQDNEASPMMMDSSSPSPSSADFLRQAPPMLERRLRPPHDQPLKCPRCDSTHTKFCYYNNYSLSQPRYFCKTCRRYWTKGGSLRNVPVGGGCRKNKRSGGAKRAAAASAASADHHPLPLGQFPPPGGTFMDIAAGLGSTELQLSTLPSLLQPSPPPLSHLNPGARGLAGFMECKYGLPMGFDIAEAKFGGFLADPRGQFLLGVDGGGFGETGQGFAATFGGGFQMDGELHGAVEAENCQRLALPWNTGSGEGIGMAEAKPDPKMLSLEWQEQCGETAARGPFVYAAAHDGGGRCGAELVGATATTTVGRRQLPTSWFRELNYPR